MRRRVNSMSDGNGGLSAAKKAKNDEFYTQWCDIEAEMNAYYEFDNDVFRDQVILLPCDDPDWSAFTKYFSVNFQKFGLKKLISTSYVYKQGNGRASKAERESPYYDPEKSKTRGKFFITERDVDGDGRVGIDDIEFKGYLEGDGDFRSTEVTKFRDEADIIITNPPFSLFREFLAWIMQGKKKFSIIGNVNAITYKEVFPLIRNNMVWLGESIHSGDRMFNVPDWYPLEAAGCGIDKNGQKFIRVKGVRWFTNLDFGRRHESLSFMTMEDNLMYNKKLRKKLKNEYGRIAYPKYDNYDAIEIPFTECIPSDYLPGWLVPSELEQDLIDGGYLFWKDEKGNAVARADSSGKTCVCTEGELTSGRERCNGVMGVPITFMDRYNPRQFQIIGCSYSYGIPTEWDPKTSMSPSVDGKNVYKRLLIRAACSNAVPA